MSPECVTCNGIGTCATVTPEKILAHYTCPNHQEVSPAEVKARCNIITKFGRAGVDALLFPDGNAQEA